MGEFMDNEELLNEINNEEMIDILLTTSKIMGVNCIVDDKKKFIMLIWSGDHVSIFFSVSKISDYANVNLSLYKGNVFHYNLDQNISTRNGNTRKEILNNTLRLLGEYFNYLN
jgi:hypothetical protein